MQHAHKTTYRIRRNRFRLAGAIGACALALATLPTLHAQATPVSDGNPDLPSLCGADVTLVLDDSNSLDATEAQLVRDAADAFVTALIGTPSRVKVVVFQDRATGIDASGNATSVLADTVFRDPADYTAPTDGDGAGNTNWDDSLEVARRSTEGAGDVLVFITDGEPTRHNTTTPDGHLDNGTHAIADNAANLTNAVTEADAIKAGGTHMFGIGVGLTTAAQEQNMNDVTGDEELTLDGGGNPNISFREADYTIAPDFDDLEPIIRAFVRDLCGPSLNVTKYLQHADGTTTKADATTPWTFHANVSPTPTIWHAPMGATGATADATTGADGSVTFNWEVDPSSASVDLTEDGQTGWVYNGARCTRNLLDGSSPTVILDTVGTNAPNESGDATELLDMDIASEQSVACDVHNREIRLATIDVVKQTVPAGATDTFDFTLSSGGSTVDSIDDLGDGDTESFDPVAAGTYTVAEAAAAGYTSAGTCDDVGTGAVETTSPVDLVVAEGAHWTCTFVNTVIPPDPDEADLSIEKSVDGDLIAGESGTYELVVANAGPDDAADVTVVDQLPDGVAATAASGDGWTCDVTATTVTCDRPTLASGASSTITISVDVAAGAEGQDVTNVADVDATTDDPDPGNNHDEVTTLVAAAEPQNTEQTSTTTIAPGSTTPGPNVDDGSLARTGTDIDQFVAVGLTLVVLGGATLLIRRRRFDLR